MEQKRVDIFGSFLTGESSAPAQSAVPAEIAPASRPASGEALPNASELEKSLLSQLAAAHQSVDVKSLLAQSSASPSQLLKILKDMEDVGLVARDTGQSYSLTDLGRDVADPA